MQVNKWFEKEVVPMKTLKAMMKCKKGQGMVEYALLIAVVVAVLVAISPNLKGAITGVFQNAVDAVSGAAGVANS